MAPATAPRARRSHSNPHPPPKNQSKGKRVSKAEETTGGEEKHEDGGRSRYHHSGRRVATPPKTTFLQHNDFARFGNSILEPALERRTGFPSTRACAMPQNISPERTRGVFCSLRSCDRSFGRGEKPSTCAHRKAHKKWRAPSTEGLTTRLPPGLGHPTHTSSPTGGLATRWHRSQPPPVGLNSPNCHLNPHTEGIPRVNVTISPFTTRPSRPGLLCEGFEAPSLPQISSKPTSGRALLLLLVLETGTEEVMGTHTELNVCTKGQASKSLHTWHCDHLPAPPAPRPGSGGRTWGLSTSHRVLREGPSELKAVQIKRPQGRRAPGQLPLPPSPPPCPGSSAACGVTTSFEKKLCEDEIPSHPILRPKGGI